jgi:hypothetical protein
MSNEAKNTETADTSDTQTAPVAAPASPLAIDQIERFANNLKLAIVDIPDLGKIQIRELDSNQAGRISAMAEKQAANITPYIVTQCLYDGNGARALTDGHINRVKGWKAMVTKRIADAVLELSGIEMVITAEEIAENQKN